MTKQRYLAVQAWFLSRPAALRLLKALNSLAAAVVYASYILMVLFLAFLQDGRIFRVLAVPAFVFLAGTVLRRIINAPRPYQVYETPPLTPKNKQGESFPSRHLFSASVIAVCGFYLCPPLGWLLTACTLILAPVRVLAGVHFIKDVTVGAAAGALVGWLGFFVL